MQRSYKLSLTGDLGSGKSTVAKDIAEKFNLEIVSIGKIQRKMAEELGLNTTSFNVYMEQHPEYDKKLDDILREHEIKEGRFLFDSRMAWNFVPSSFKVYMACSLEESARRIINADRNDEKYSSLEEAIKKITERRASEKARYLQMYGVDITNKSNYDLVVDTDNKTPNEVIKEIEVAFEKWIKGE